MNFPDPLNDCLALLARLSPKVKGKTPD